MGGILGIEKRKSRAEAGMNIHWSVEAVNDLACVRTFVSQDNAAAARRLASRIIQAIESLAENPAVGRQGRVTGTRELVVPHTPFIVPYRVRFSRLEILRIYHGARRWPDIL